ncbi:MAG: rhamnan synthesis F family protein [Paracoccaceae bacterium]
MHPATQRRAIYLIYPEHGVLDSHIMALNWLHQHGVSALVVSNLALSDFDRARLTPCCWAILERPNIGYDFGGYRDGVLQIADQLSDLQQLIILNDSTWFPLPGSQDWLQNVSDLGVDFAGAVPHMAVKAQDSATFQDQRWTYDATSTRFYYASFALAFGPNILKDAGFLEYWQSLRLASAKNTTVRRGEVGLSQWVLKRGYTHASTLELTKLDQHLAQLGLDRLRQITRDVIALNNLPLADTKQRLLNDLDTVSSGTLVAFLLYAGARQGVSYALQNYTIKERGFSFLKKSPIRLNADGRDITLALIDCLDGPTAEIIKSEARQIQLTRFT